ncbi:MAG TPA: hypothetical protein VGI43_09180 [Mucilaginibacter sp.]|jgi:hypothetical protein
MDHNVSPQWDTIKIFLLRWFSLYLILIFLFLSNYLETYHFLAFLNYPFHDFTVSLTRLVAHLFFKKGFTAHVEFRDYYWTYVASLSYLFIAAVIVIVWTITDKAEKSKKFFAYAIVFARYYLATILLGYGISKVLGDQFGRPDFAALIQPLGNFDSHGLFWEFMGASKSYQAFAGLVETIAGILLLFRPTVTLGCLVALAALTNILILDIAYDTFVKVRLFYFILLTIFILLPDLKRLFQIFILKQSASLTTPPPIIENKKYNWLLFTTKFCFICFVIFIILRKHKESYPLYHDPANRSIAGVYKINEFYLNQQSQQLSDSIRWGKMAINNYFPILSVQFVDDSIAEYYFKSDTINKIIDLNSSKDPQFKARLHYTNGRSGEWIFDGTFKSDSIHFTSKKIKMNFNLEKKYSEIIWDYDF